MRAEPSHRSEQVSQVLFGERVEVLAKEKDGWLKVCCEWDEYEGWVKEGQVICILYKEYRKPLLNYSSSPNDVIQIEHGQFVISPGSSLFHLKKRKMTWSKREFDFKGKKLPIKLAAATEDNINAFSKMFIGAPYQWGGRSVLGIDCSGLTQVVFKLMNIRIPRDASQQAEIGETVSFLQEAKCGDLAFFDNAEGKITHVGILLNDHTIIHATETTGRVVIDPIDNGGIISRQLKMRTHNLRLVKRIF